MIVLFLLLFQELTKNQSVKLVITNLQDYNELIVPYCYI
jgi:hypothetical protein